MHLRVHTGGTWGSKWSPWAPFGQVRIFESFFGGFGVRGGGEGGGGRRRSFPLETTVKGPAASP